MCTLSVIRPPRDGVLRIAFNRDELLARPNGLPPRIVRAGDGFAIMPLDAQAGGTWIAVNDRGLAMAVLNVNRAAAPPPAPMSRGAIIPRLIHCASVSEASRAASVLPITMLAPFRLVLIDRDAMATIVSDGSTATTHELDAPPVMFTSSALGDHLVERPRRELFHAMVRDAAPETQDAFHDHRWPDRPHVSVSMRRPGAATISRTVIEIGAKSVCMRYADVAPDGGDVTRVSLDLQPASLP